MTPPITEPPRDAQFAQLQDRVDVLITETRGARMHRERVEKTLTVHGAALERLEAGLFESLGTLKRVETLCVQAAQSAAHALREAQAARSGRGESWTDELAREAAERGLNIRSDELKAQAARNAKLWRLVYLALAALIAAVSGWATSHLR